MDPSQGFIRRKTLSFLLLIIVLLSVSCQVNDLRLTPLAEDVQLGKIYAMKQRFWSLNDQFIIRDDQNRPIYQVNGKIFTIGDKLSFRDLQGNELAYISERVLSLLKRYRIYRPDGNFALVKKKFTLFGDRYTIKVPNEPDIEIQGNFWEMEYSFFRKGRLVAIASKKLLSWTDSYAVQVARHEDDILILAAAVIIDLVNQDEEKAHHAHHH